LVEEYEKLLQARDKDVHDNSKRTTLPIASQIVETYVLDDVKAPWYIDLLNINLNNHDLHTAKERIKLYMDSFKEKPSNGFRALAFKELHASIPRGK
jgi:malate synthase